ncbi:MAG: hypothetical protein IT385_28300 [Deltaproteobacteria bacterium]|nr:hypothetical protein [Deltaproteobacteria bacterium]
MNALRPTVKLLSFSVASLVAVLGGCGEDEQVAAEDTTPATDLEVATPDVPTHTCGDGVIQGPERCDDGPLNGQYGQCAAGCMDAGPRCGDGVTQADREACDDGDDNGDYGKCGYGCNGPAERCGNGFIETAHEVCDDGDKNGTYGWCATDCQGAAAGCGDGVVTAPFESCDDGADNGLPGRCPADCNPTPGCGDGQLVAPEVCDDGPANGGYGACAADCGGDGPRCGDGLRDRKHEACDDGEHNGRYGFCRADCQGRGPHCGDGQTQADAGEACDDGAQNGAAGHCNLECTGPMDAWVAGPDALKDQSALDGRTCAEDDLLGKYMRYRLRFRGDGTAADPGFIAFGTAPGEGMPASRREPMANCGGHWAFESCPRPDLADARGIYNWGDGTVWLGEYIALLAMEHAMFTHLGLPTAETASDLRYALMALDRIDEVAETFFQGATPVRDGLYVRDDVPVDFHLLPGGGYRFPRNDDGQAGYECVSGDLLCDPPDIEDGSFTSQDQTIALIFGLALVDRLTPDLVVDGLAVGPDAREKVHRLVWFLRKNGWKVKDPTGGSPPDAWGGNAIGFSNAMAKVANAVVGDEHGVSDYRNFASRTLGEAAWAGLQVIWQETHGYNRSHALKLAAANGVWDADKMPSMAMQDGKDYYALAWSLLQGHALEAPYSDWRIEALLRSAPCSGPCRGPGCTNEVIGWMGESRTMNPEDRAGSRHWQGQFNGMDYMATFAAYYLYRQGRFTHTRPDRVPADCRGFVGLEQILASGATEGQVYDPAHACAAALDLDRELCRRPFGGWLQDAMRGKVTIWAGGGRWTCTPGGACVIHLTDDEDTGDDDLILGTAGADELAGGGGNDCVMGFGGDDRLEGNQGYDEIHGGEGADRLYGEGRLLVVDGEGDVLFGGPGDDYLDGAPGKDELHGEDGDDEIDGGNGEDWLIGGRGNDKLTGNLADDSLIGGDGDDALDGGWGADQMWGGPGRDKLDGDLGDDHLDGGIGPDFLRGGDGDDSLASGDDWGTNSLDHDRLCGNGGDDTMWGGWDGDECLGGGWLFGGSDTIQGCDDETADTGDCDKGAYDTW